MTRDQAISALRKALYSKVAFQNPDTGALSVLVDMKLLGHAIGMLEKSLGLLEQVDLVLRALPPSKLDQAAQDTPPGTPPP